MPDPRQEEEALRSARDFRVSARKVAMWSAVLTVAALVALVIVAVDRGAAALDTVALYLAVVAFVSQLIMYVAQNESAARQLKQSQDVQRETSMMLRGIQEQAAGMQRLLNEQYGAVINALVDRATEATAAGRLPRSGPPDETPGVDDELGLLAPTPEARAALEELRESLRAEFADTAAEAVQRYAVESRLPVFPTSGPPSSGVTRMPFSVDQIGQIHYVDDQQAADRAATKRAAQRRSGRHAAAEGLDDSDLNGDSDRNLNADDRHLDG
jgi:hypothetical protein